MKDASYSIIKSVFTVITLLILLVISSQSVAPTLAQNPQTTVFVNVNVIPMDTERVLENQTVLVEGDRITAIGPAAEVTVPDGAEIIEGNGAYLMPGLADMHVHLEFDYDPHSMRLHLANGVTTIRNLNAIVPEHFEWREQVEQGKLLGPTIYTSGNSFYGVPPFLKTTVLMFRAQVILAPLLLGLLVWLIIWLVAKFTPLIANFSQIRRYILPSLGGLLVVGLLLSWFRVIPLTTYMQQSFPFVAIPESEAEARQMIRDQKAMGADFVKPHDWMSREIYFALLDEADKQGLYAAGHLTDSPEYVTLEEAIAAGQDEVVHADEFMSYFFVDFDPLVDDWVEYEVDMSRIDGIAALMAENDVALCPTLITNETVLLGLEDIEMIQGEEYRVIRPELMQEWLEGGRLVNWRGQEDYRRQAWRPAMMQLTKAMHDHGALVTLGTDPTIEGVIPGYSAHLELPLLVEAGLSNFEALATGTRNAAQVTGRMGAADDWGTVVTGNRADLILLPNNPLEDVTHTQERIGVMVRGQWFTQAELDGLVDEFVASYDDGQEALAIITVPHGNHDHTIVVRRSDWQQVASSLALHPGYTRPETADYTPYKYMRLHLLLGSFLILVAGWGIRLQIRRHKNLSNKRLVKD